MECTIDYDVNQSPYFQIYESRFPSETHQLEFFKSYISEFDDLSLVEELDTQAEQMIKVGYTSMAKQNFLNFLLFRCLVDEFLWLINTCYLFYTHFKLQNLLFS